ncbi:three component ABC system middle component [Dictyobacter aurantiacus]|uniref:three component ABC system middle component n=1 Tax=Dictyobacter aurantiacus TaxID=1936993 RepID=UPI00269F5BF0
MSWDRRPIEIASLLNPAFCGEVIRRCIVSFEEVESEPFPFPLVYLVLPIVLHTKTRETMRSERQLHVWLQSHEDMKIGFADRTRQLVPITKEAILFLLQVHAITFDDQARLSTAHYRRRVPQSQKEGEIESCYKAAGVIGRWFARAGSVTTIYVLWGVRP